MILHAKFQDHPTTGFEREDFKRILPYMCMVGTMSCDLNHL